MEYIYLERCTDGTLNAFLKREGFTVKGGKGWAEDILAEYVWLGAFNLEGNKYWTNTGKKNAIRNSAMSLSLVPMTDFTYGNRMYALM
jgi:hypothetical protein